MFLSRIQRFCCSTLPSTSAFALLASSYPIRHPDSVSSEQGHLSASNPEGKLLFNECSHLEESKHGTKKWLDGEDRLGLSEKQTSSEPQESLKRVVKQKVSESGSRQEFYMREDEIKLAKSTGIGIGDEKLGAYLMDALLSKSPDGNTLGGMKISMFDLHSRRFAEQLLNAGVYSLSIVETSQNEAQKAKEYAGKVRKKRGILVGAYRANMESLFPLCTRKKQAPFPGKLLFANQQLMKDSVNPLTLRMDASLNDDESGDNQKFAPVIIGSLPTANQQSNMLTSLVYSLITHLYAVKQDTMFRYGAVQLITFLSASNYALAVCALDPNMQFVSNGNKHKSWLLNKLFTIKSISGYSGFSRSAFSPQFPLPKTFPYEKKFNSIGIRNENLYGITIEPKRTIRAGNLSLVNNLREDEDHAEVVTPSETLMKYAFWITFTGKMTAKTKVVQKLREWFPKSSIDLSTVVESDAKVADLKLEDFDRMFSLLHREMNDDFTHVAELKNFCAQFRPTKMDARFAD